LKGFPGTAWNARLISIENPAISFPVTFQIELQLTSLPDPQCFDPGAVKTGAKLGRLIAMKLQNIQRYPAQNLIDLFSIGIYEQPYPVAKQTGSPG
jgi:hypothetical protein